MANLALRNILSNSTIRIVNYKNSCIKIRVLDFNEKSVS
jgi:hypothetical protein